MGKAHMSFISQEIASLISRDEDSQLAVKSDLSCSGESTHFLKKTQTLLRTQRHFSVLRFQVIILSMDIH